MAWNFIKGVEVSGRRQGTFTVPVQTSNPQGAFSNLPISDPLLPDIQMSRPSIKFSFQSSPGRTFAVANQPDWLSSGYEKLTAN